MARYKKYDYNQTVMLPISLKNQLEVGTLEYAIKKLVDEKIDRTVFDKNYHNDDTGCPAYDPKLLLKVVLLAYSRGITGSRKIEKACRENVIFMAISCGISPQSSDNLQTFLDRGPKMSRSRDWITLIKIIRPYTDLNQAMDQSLHNLQVIIHAG